MTFTKARRAKGGGGMNKTLERLSNSIDSWFVNTNMIWKQFKEFHFVFLSIFRGPYTDSQRAEDCFVFRHYLTV